MVDGAIDFSKAKFYAYRRMGRRMFLILAAAKCKDCISEIIPITERKSFCTGQQKVDSAFFLFLHFVADRIHQRRQM